MKSRLEPYYSVLFTNKNGFVAHELILDITKITEETGVTEEDIAKRLMDYSFHAPTVSFPVPKTVMIEPTESENLQELDRFIDTLISIKGEIDQIKRGEMDRQNNPLKNAPHTLKECLSD